VAARGETFVIELAWILEIADAAHPGFKFHKLAVGKVWRPFAVANRQVHPDASFGRKLKIELVATFGERRGRDDAAFQEHCLAGARVDCGRASGPVQDREKGAAKQKKERGADIQDARTPSPSEVGETQEERQSPDKIVDSEMDKPSE